MALRSCCSGALALVAVAACHRPTEVTGLYVAQDSAGMFFACDDPKHPMIIQDSALVARYRKMVSAQASNEPLYVQLRGVRGHEGSVYGGQRSFFVQRILEMRPRQSGECPHVAQPVTPMLSR